ncbi:hypothetical protein GLYMA_02G061902v4 [Glycine max]|nr:hypothetical protein GLYMA_02G061902v4 [Glycine max]KAH1058983.1 hypothetical protein GYH30_003175 [Glycine max]
MLVWRSQKKTIRYNFLYRSQSLSKFCPLGMIKGKGFSGTKRYFGDLGTTLRSAGSNIAFAAVAEISDSVLKGEWLSTRNSKIGYGAISSENCIDGRWSR